MAIRPLIRVGLVFAVCVTFATDALCMPDASSHGPVTVLAYIAALVAICVIIHAAGLIALYSWLTSVPPAGTSEYLSLL